MWALRAGIGRDDEEDPYVFWLDWIGNPESVLVNCRRMVLDEGQSITSVKLASNQDKDLVAVSFEMNDGDRFRSGPVITD